MCQDVQLGTGGTAYFRRGRLLALLLGAALLAACHDSPAERVIGSSETPRASTLGEIDIMFVFEPNTWTTDDHQTVSSDVFFVGQRFLARGQVWRNGSRVDANQLAVVWELGRDAGAAAIDSVRPCGMDSCVYLHGVRQNQELYSPDLRFGVRDPSTGQGDLYWHQFGVSDNIIIYPPDAQLAVGESRQAWLKYDYYGTEYAYPMNLATWWSSDPSVATVDWNGAVRAVSAGRATIYARVGDVWDLMPVTVWDPEGSPEEGECGFAIRC
ncbi:MAG TPA: Ig-like domain-containing protein [Longimicrobiaceae bacterium]|nr:Ig-like domain-containing protein [Longimicrobiaceae bacterium]